MLKFYRQLFHFLKPYWLYLVGALLSTIVVTILVGVVPLGTRYLVNVIGQKNLRILNLAIGAGILLVITKGIFTYLRNYLMAFVGQRVVADLRSQVFAHLQKLSFAFYVKWRTGELISRILNDVSIIQTTLVESLVVLLPQSILLLGLLAIMFYFNWRLALIVMLGMPVISYAIARYGQEIRKITNRIQGKVADISSILQETISGIRVVKSFSREDYEIKRFQVENEKNFSVALERERIIAAQWPVVEFLSLMGVFAVLWFSGRELISGRTTAGNLVGFFTCILMSTDPVLSLSHSYGRWQQAIAAIQRITELLETKSEIRDSPRAIELPPIKGRVEFDRIYFEYESQKTVLQNLNFGCLPGEIIALVGPSGAGKTTLMNLIPRFYDPTSGEIRIDGYPLTEVKIVSLRQQIGIVPQETILFSGTIRDNIRYGKLEATEEEIVAAAVAANAHDFIMELPQGYDSEVGERGVKLSAGQRQRIALARVILKDPHIILLDEATSALDSESEHLVQEAITRLLKGRTTFIIAHRLSTVRKADRIVVLQDGKIVEMGTHKELMEKEGPYCKLYRNQLQDFVSVETPTQKGSSW